MATVRGLASYVGDKDSLWLPDNEPGVPLTPGGAPTSFTASALSPTQVRLSWGAPSPVNDAVNWVVRWGTSSVTGPSAGNHLATLPLATRSLTHSGRNGNVKYYYWIASRTNDMLYGSGRTAAATTPSGIQTYEFNSIGSKTWRKAWGSWRSGDDHLQQSVWNGSGTESQGLWIYSKSDLDKIKGKKCLGIKIYAKRLTSRHGVYADRAIRFRTHRHKYGFPNPPPGRGSAGLSWLGTTHTTAWNWDLGTARWTTLPVEMGQQLCNGTAGGVGIYWPGGGNSQYVFLYGRSVLATSGRISITVQ